MSRTLNEIQQVLACNLKIARQLKGISQENLAFAAEVDRTYISQIERGIGNPSVNVLLKIAKELDVDILDLLKND
ncbi:COG1476 Predicted transcriptional regulators [uncultured Caudovirales phage]|uniref:COG1476 Predicted transcriptional regulators n=1 Tax=uncultured Caudovirales phage TaxID=2100421 RepID=A0A6J5KLC0_9CAUD|nr:COG1476 Predicted transcriptional regulators [uncultured Caudovirales phage]